MAADPPNPDKPTGSQDPLHCARLAMRELLNSCGLEDEPWFWYAEVGIYGKARQWEALLSKRCRTWSTDEYPFDYVDDKARASQRWSDFYRKFVKITGRDNILSLTRAMENQFGAATETTAPMPLFAEFHANEVAADDSLQAKLINRVERLQRISSDRYQTVPSTAELSEMKEAVQKHSIAESVKQYANYVTQAMNLGLDGTNDPDNSVYPEHAWLFAIPAYEVQDGHPILLANFILFIDISDILIAEEVDQRRRFREIERRLLDLELQSTRILSHRFYKHIDGFIPGEDPVIKLAHPSLCKGDYLNALRLESLQSHGEEQFKKLYDSQSNDASECWHRAFERTRYGQDGSLKEMGEGNLTLIPEHAQNVAWVRLDSSEAKRAFHWLKPLYAHVSSRAHLPYEPSDNGEYHFGWLELRILCGLLSRLDHFRGHQGGPDLTVAAYIWPTGRADCLPDLPFCWPVEPGVRLLIPWLHMIQELIGEKIERGNRAPQHIEVVVVHGHPNVSVVEGSKASQEYDGDSPAIKEWLALQNDKDSRPNGLLAAVKYTPASQEPESTLAIRRLARGWTRALIDPVRRRGNSTSRIQHLILGDIGAVLMARRLKFDRSDPLFQPLEGSMPIDIDIYASDDELCVAVTWHAKQIKA